MGRGHSHKKWVRYVADITGDPAAKERLERLRARAREGDHFAVEKLRQAVEYGEAAVDQGGALENYPDPSIQVRPAVQEPADTDLQGVVREKGAASPMGYARRHQPAEQSPDVPRRPCSTCGRPTSSGLVIDSDPPKLLFACDTRPVKGRCYAEMIRTARSSGVRWRWALLSEVREGVVHDLLRPAWRYPPAAEVTITGGE